MLEDRTVRSLAAEAGLATRDAVERLRAAGFSASNHTILGGRDLARARKVLDLAAPDAPRRLSEDEIVVQLLGPLLRKGKVGSTRTTEFTNVWGHGVPPHQKDQAREMAERMLLDGLLAEKPSVGRRHVWLTQQGQARLAAARLRLEGADQER